MELLLLLAFFFGDSSYLNFGSSTALVNSFSCIWTSTAISRESKNSFSFHHWIVLNKWWRMALFSNVGFLGSFSPKCSSSWLEIRCAIIELFTIELQLDVSPKSKKLARLRISQGFVLPPLNQCNWNVSHRYCYKSLRLSASRTSPVGLAHAVLFSGRSEARILRPVIHNM